MLVNRREAFWLTTAGALCGSGASAQDDFEKSDDLLPPLPVRFGPDTQSDYQPNRALGITKPPELDFRVAEALMHEAPYDCAPIKVARYWRNIGRGIIPDLKSAVLQQRVGRHFARGWPNVYNPVIIDFFSMTSLNPLKGEGDGTAWCAAFLNWCIARSQAKSRDLRELRQTLASGSHSASSGSFRCWGEKVVETKDGGPGPQEGDIVVWATAGTVHGCAEGPGHVAFYADTAPDGRLIVVGGNQTDPATIIGATRSSMCQKAIPRTFNVARRGSPPVYKSVLCFRTAPFLKV